MGLVMYLFSFKMGNDVILMWVANLETQGPWGLLLISHSRCLPQCLPPPFLASAALAVCSGPHTEDLTLSSSWTLAMGAQQDTIPFVHGRGQPLA